MISYDEFIELAQKIYKEVKKEFCKRTKDLLFASSITLPEEIIISPLCVKDKDLPGVVVLGRFDAVDLTGLNTPSFFITIFYGSFLKEFSYASKDKIEEGLYETITHEIIHYYETNLGTRELSKLDLEFRRDLFKRYLGRG